MADKELTVYVVDMAAPEARHYMYDTLAGKLLRGLKTDYVSVVAFHDTRTNHQLAHTGKFQGVNVVVDFETPSFEQIQTTRDTLDAPLDTQSACDAFQALVFSVSLFQPTRKKVFTRNIVLLTSAESPMASFSAEKAAAVPNLLAEMPVNLYVVLAEAKLDKWDNWTALAAKFTKGLVMDAAQARRVTQLDPPLRKTRPLPVYKGEMRLGANFDKVLHDQSYDPEMDDGCLNFKVEVYPAAKSEVSASGAHEYVVDNDQVVRIERRTKHFVWERNFQGERTSHPEKEEVDEKLFDKVDVEAASFVPGFKFSNFDLIALDDNLMDAAKLQFGLELDVIGLLPVAAVPYFYFTDEALYVVPEKSSSVKNLLAYSAFCDAAHEMGLALLARFVRKQAKEIEVGAMFPVKIKKGTDTTNAFIYIRLPYKEDEKIGKFPKLAAKEAKKGAKKEESAMDKLMEEFVELKTLDEQDTDKSVIDNYKVVMTQADSSKLPLPPQFRSDNPFLCNSPGHNKYGRYLRKILLSSLDAKDWIKHFQNPRFVEDNLREGEPFTNFLNLGNALEVSSSVDPKWLYELSARANEVSKRLVKELGVAYVRKEDVKKRKVKRDGPRLQTKGDYGADEGNYDAVPDFDF